MEWQDETTTWVDLKDFKEASKIELAEYTVSNRIDNEPDFYWWVYYVFNKRDRIIAKFKTNYWRKIHKYDLKGTKDGIKIT